MKEREKEAEADSRDRHKEKEEMEELRKKLEEEGHPDPEQEINKRQNPQQSSTLLLQQNPTIPATSVPVSDHNNHASNRSNSHHQVRGISLFCRSSHRKKKLVSLVKFSHFGIL